MNRLLIQGKRLGISPDNPDEGVWLADQETGKIVSAATVERSDSQTIDCVFVEPPEPGTYTLVVACRNGAQESLALQLQRSRVLLSGIIHNPQFGLGQQTIVMVTGC